MTLVASLCHIIDFCNAGLSLFCTGGALKRMFEWFYSWLPRTEDYRWRHWTRILSPNWWVDRSLLHDDDDDNDDNDDDDDDDNDDKDGMIVEGSMYSYIVYTHDSGGDCSLE